VHCGVYTSEEVPVLTSEARDATEECIAENTILAYLAGELRDHQLSHVEQHLDSCSACFRVVVVAHGHARSSAPVSIDGPTGVSRRAPARAGERGWPSIASLADAADTQALLAALRSVDDEDYTVERELTRGGMGRILLAVDRQGRRVALKVLLNASSEATARFVREVQVTARLQHPSIITLHEAGRWRSGEPFFAMKLVDGRSLRQELTELTSLQQRLALLPRLIAVVDALAYAHDRGVIHRDLKPANILIGAFGETVVIDWGLAKVRNVPDLEASDLAGSSPPLGGTLVTEAGSMLGTPVYMAPEQARGEAVDERADVYGLGALLYHSLSGRPPYSGNSAKEVLRSVLTAAPRPLEVLMPELPADLGAIVRKAMLPNAADRYLTAKEMAEDLRRFAAGQLVSAHAYTLGNLLRRWLRKNRATVGVAAALVLLGAMGAALGVQRILRERNRAEAQSTIAAAQQQSAEGLVDFLITGFRERVSKADRLDLLAGLGDEVARYYRGIEGSGASTDASLLRNRAATLETLGIVEFDKRDLRKARQLYEQALQLWAQADAARAPTPAELVRQGRTWQRLGVLEHVQGNADAAIAAHRRAIELADRSIALDPELLDGQLLAATNLGRIGETLQHRSGDLQGSFDALTSAVERLEPRLARQPQELPVLQRLALLRQSLSDRQLALGQLDDAAASIQQSIELFAAVARQDPNDAEVAREHAFAFTFLALVEVARGRLGDALDAQRTLLERYTGIARADPGNVATEEDIATGQMVYGALLRRGLQLDQAEAAETKAVDLFEAHVRQTQAQKSKSLLVMALVDLARIQTARGQRVAARERLLQAAEVARAMLAQDTKSNKTQQSLAFCLTWLADVQLKLRASAGAAAAASEARALVQALATAVPHDAEVKEDLARTLYVAGEVARSAGNAEEARAALEQARGVYDGLAQRSPGMVEYRLGLAKTSTRLAQVLAAATPEGRRRSAQLLEQARALLDELHASQRLFLEDDALRLRLSHSASTLAIEPGW
jgi:tetratricopeptide (TPR) repeat protein